MNKILSRCKTALGGLLVVILLWGLCRLLGACSTLPELADIRQQAQTAAVTPLQVEDANGPVSRAEGEQRLAEAADHAAPVAYLEQLAKVEQALTDQPLIAGNRATLLVDGPSTYDSLFAALAAATDHIHLETYILNDDRIGQRLAEILLDRRAHGVAVALIYDAIGSWEASEAYFARLRDAGVQLYTYHPVDEFWNINQRHHRKLAIIDGRIAYTGGINISNVYSSSSFSSPQGAPSADDRWRDTHVRIEGPAVASFQRLFLAIWNEQEPPPPLTGKLFPELPDVGEALVRVVASHGGDDEYDIYETYLAILAQARERVWMTQAYFAPDERLLHALAAAVQRGVDVRILLPGFTDATLVLYASQSYYDELLTAGVKLYQRSDALLHAKTAVVDGIWSTVGSSNFDYRSFLHNNEANAVILERDFGRAMEELFQFDLSRAQPITLADWQQRGLWSRFMENIAYTLKYWF